MSFIIFLLLGLKFLVELCVQIQIVVKSLLGAQCKTWVGEIQLLGILYGVRKGQVISVLTLSDFARAKIMYLVRFY